MQDMLSRGSSGESGESGESSTGGISDMSGRIAANSSGLRWEFLPTTLVQVTYDDKNVRFTYDDWKSKVGRCMLTPGFRI